MISRKQLVQRIADRSHGQVGVEIPEGILSYIFGGCAPEDFCQSFHSSY